MTTASVARAHVEVAATVRADPLPPVADRLSRIPGRGELHTALWDVLAAGGGAVLFIDMDHFKRINDTLGHHAGDQLLVEFADRLSANLPEDATVSRFGGDEFVVVLPCTASAVAAAIGDQLLACMRRPFRIAGRDLIMSASIGITSTGERAPHAVDPQLLLQEADTALFEAKRLGRGRSAAFTSELRRRLVERVELEADLRRALDGGELRLHYQPQIDLASGRIVGVEALARWPRPDGSVVPAAEFIGVAEESGLIDALGRWAIESACAQLSAWRRAPRAPAVVSVNLSPLQLRDLELVDVVAGALERHDVPASSLCLELTESGFERLDEEVDTLARLRSLGCYVGIDDFGTGYSSLGRLRDLPVEVLKIDRGFVRGLGTNADDSAIVAAIMSLAFTLGLHVIAEGVETPAQAHALTRLGCPVAQGYLFARPAPAEGVAQLLAGPRVWRPISGDEAAADGVLPPAAAEPRRGHRSFIVEFLHQIGIEVQGAP